MSIKQPFENELTTDEANNIKWYMTMYPATGVNRDAMRYITDLEARIKEVHNWAVCAAIATPEDMMRNMNRIIEVTKL